MKEDTFKYPFDKINKNRQNRNPYPAVATAPCSAVSFSGKISSNLTPKINTAQIISTPPLPSECFYVCHIKCPVKKLYKGPSLPRSRFLDVTQRDIQELFDPELFCACRAERSKPVSTSQALGSRMGA